MGKLAISQEELEITLNGIDVGIMLVDSAGRIVFANHKAGLLLGCAGYEMVGNRFGEFMRRVVAPNIMAPTALPVGLT